MASSELQSKLQRRRVLNKEGDAPTLVQRQPAAAFQHFYGNSFGPPQAAPFGLGSHLLGQVIREEPGQSLDFSEADDEEARELREEIDAAAAECGVARREKTKIETQAVSRGLELGTEVAKLRIDVEVMRRDLEASQHEVHRLRRGAVAEDHKSRRRQDVAQRQDLEALAAQARKKGLSIEVEDSAKEKAVLEEQVHSLETEVQQHVFSRVRLEALLRTSEVREHELRRMLDSAEANIERVASPRLRRQASDQVAECFTMAMSDSGDEHLDEEGDALQPEQECGDLEYCYEGLDLLGLLSLDRAFPGEGKPGAQAARERAAGSHSPSSASTQEAAPLGEEGALAAWPATLAEESLYEAPLRELEFALSRLSAVSSSLEGMPTMGASAGTGETVDEPDLAAFEEQVSQLQSALDRIQASSPPSAAKALPPATPPRPEGRSLEGVSPQQTTSPTLPVPGLGGLFLSPYARFRQRYGVALAGTTPPARGA